MKNFVSGLCLSLGLAAMAVPAFADDCDEACQAVRNAQDPLADVKAIMTDNTITFGDGGASDGYNFQVQPVYTMHLDNGNNLILRGIVPIMGVPTGGGHTWGLGDTILQAFYVPKVDGGIKFGFGPQVSLPTRTSSALAGPGWGIGASAVAFGFAGNLSYGGIVGHHFAESGFSVTTVQPIVLYNTEFLGGSYFGYNNSITYDWKADQLTVPLGLTFGKTVVMESGLAVDFFVGAYNLIERAAGVGEWQGKFGVSFFFP